MKKLITALFVLTCYTWLNAFVVFMPVNSVFAAEKLTFDDVSVSLKDSTILITTINMEYAIVPVGDTDTTWYNCQDENTYPLIYPTTGNFDVYLRQKDSIANDTLFLNVSPQKGIPTYAIDYTLETAGVLAKLDEYSWNVDMSDAFLGDGGFPIDLVVDSTLNIIYIRTSLTDTSVASLIQVLNIPDRQAPPAISIDFEKQKTKQILGDTTLWSRVADMSTGIGFVTNDSLDISSFVSGVEDTLYFRHKATVFNFKSDIFELIIPARPTAPVVVMDFENEQTSIVIPETMEWSENAGMSSASSGDGNALDISTYIGSDQDSLFFRYAASISDFVSLSDTLVIPVRPSGPIFTINYATEKTNEIVTTKHTYSTISDMSSETVGVGAVISVIPGQDLFFRTLGTAGLEFSSDTSQLVLKARPLRPNLAINFVDESLISLPATAEWDTSGTYVDIAEGVSIGALIPGFSELDKTIKVREKSVGSEFASSDTLLTIKKREDAPLITSEDDFTNIITWDPNGLFPSIGDYEYSTSNGSSWIPCSNDSIDVGNSAVPLGSFQIRLKASNVSGSERFAGEVDVSSIEMTVVGRAVLSGVTLSVVDANLSNTSTDMDYAIVKTLETDTSWLACAASNTSISIYPLGDFSVFVRQQSLPNNTALVKSVPAIAGPPTYAIDFVAEKTAGIIPATDEYTWISGTWGTPGGGGQLTLTPHIGVSDSTLYLRTKATADLVASTVQNLTIKARPATPSYTVDFDLEKTGQVIAGSDKYSLNSEMSASSDGQDLKLDLSPGTNVYFQTPEVANTSFRSAIQTLVVPVRPTISYTINYAAETTAESVPAAVEWDDNAGFSSPVDGPNSNLPLTPGTNIWLQQKFTGTSFRSLKYPLTVPARPATPTTAISYTGEILTSVLANTEWDASGPFSLVFDNQSLSTFIEPSTGNNKDIHLRIKSNGVNFKSLEQTITLPKRNVAPDINVYDDNLNKITFDPIAGYALISDYEYSITNGTTWFTCTNFSQSVGDNDIEIGEFKVRLKASNTDGFLRFAGEEKASTEVMTYVGSTDLSGVSLDVKTETLYGGTTDVEYGFRIGGAPIAVWNACISGANSIFIDPAGDFEVWIRQASKITNDSLLKYVPAAAIAPAYGINFVAETSDAVIPITDEYSWVSGSFPNNGAGVKLNLTPQINGAEETLYIRHEATTDLVASQIQSLPVPARPATPIYSINHSAVTTVESIPTSVKHATQSDMSDGVAGSGSPLALTPGTNQYFQQPAVTGTSFRSGISTLTVPVRPVISFGINYANVTTNEVVGSGIQYDDNAGMSSPTTGPGTILGLIPGTNYWFIKTATSSAFASEIFLLTVPARPAMPTTIIDYDYERLISVPSGAQWNASGTFLSVGENQSLSAYIQASSGSDRNINVRIPSGGSSFASLNQEITLPKRNVAPVITTHDDALDNFTFAQVGSFSAVTDYEYSVNGGSTWMTCSSFTQNVGNIDILSGNLQVRLKASNGLTVFSGEPASSTFPMTYVASLNLLFVDVIVSSNLMTGTDPAMEYAFRLGTGSIGSWFPCANSLTPIVIDPAGDVEVYVRQASNISNSRLVKSIAPAAPAPNYSIDYTNERTNQIILGSDEYSWTNGSFGISGSGSILDVSAEIGAIDKKLYLRTKATFDAVASQVKELNVPARPVVTTYSINYSTERTNELVPATDRYSTASNMSGFSTGTGGTIPLTPGVGLYFQKPAGATSFASEIYFMSVSTRPAIAFSVDFIGERTLQVVGTDIEYDDNASMTSPGSGTGTYLNVQAGTDLWLRKKATSSSFKSTIFPLDVPSRPSAPSYSLDYVNERTNATVPSTQEWAIQSNMAGATSGSNSYVALAPSTNYYFRKKATSSVFASDPSSVLAVPARPTVTYAVNFITEQTSTGVSSLDIWSTNASMSSPITGTGSAIPLTPGTDVYLQRKAISGTSLASAVFHLDVPARPSTPAVLLDYVNEKTNIVIPSSMEWSNASNMSGATDGPGTFMTLSPSTNYYFRRKATTISFASARSAVLAVPARPTISFSVNFGAERTNESVSTNILYADNSALSSPSVGGGAAIPLTPGTDLWFRQTAVPNTSLASGIFFLNVPSRPSMVNYNIDYVLERTTAIIPSSVEWANIISMVGATTGNNNALTLTPATSYYFRRKSTLSTFASDISTLTVPARPGISYSVNFIQETTNQAVASSDVWALNASMTSPTTGNGSVLSLTPGTDVWFQKPAEANSSLASNVFYLPVPDRASPPVFTLDYIKEETKENVSTVVEWSTQSNLSGAQLGSNLPISLSPATSYYFRKRATSSAFASSISSALAVPPRPVISFSIDYSGERTNESVLSSIIWSNSSDMSDPTQGIGARLSLLPGSDVWFKQIAVQNGSLASAIFFLNIPDRPEIPQVKIDYMAELLTNVPPSCQWNITGSLSPVSNNTDLSAYIPSYGSSNRTVNLKVVSTLSSFASLPRDIVLPARKRAPSITAYDDVSEPNSFTWTTITGFNQVTDYEYNINNTSWEACSNGVQAIPSDVEILAGDLTLRLAASNSPGNERFAGEHVASNTTFSGEKAIALNGVAIDLIQGKITGTTIKMEYSLNSTNWTDGTWVTASASSSNVTFNLSGGFSVYVRQIGLERNRRVVAVVATAADAPSYGINYFNETLDNPLQASDESTWNSNLSGFISGDGSAELTLKPGIIGKTVYIRTKMTETVVASKVQELAIPARETITFSIDFENENTIENIPLNVEYAYNDAMTTSRVGEEKVLKLKPNEDVWFRKLATELKFKSAIFHLLVPSRVTPTPLFSIDYAQLETQEIVSDKLQYWDQTNPSLIRAGSNEKLLVEPGISVYFRHISEGGKFASDVFELVVPFRPEKPQPTINYQLETLTTIGDVCEWLEGSSYITIGEGENISLLVPETGTKNLPIRLKATEASFASEDTLLELSSRPDMPTFVDYDDEADVLTWQEVPGYDLVDLYEYSLNNGNSWSTCISESITVGDIRVPVGELKLRIAANSEQGKEHFAGKEALSEQLFTAVTLLTYEAVDVNLRKGILFGTTYEMEYSLNSTVGLDGDWMSAMDDTTYIDFSMAGGYNVFVRQKGKEGNYGLILAIPYALPAPEFKIDFVQETMDQPVGDSMIVANNAAMHGATRGNNELFQVSPGNADSVLYIQMDTSAHRVPSAIQALKVPRRLNAPYFAIDFFNEATTEVVPETIEWSNSITFEDAKVGSNFHISVNPKEVTDSLFFRYQVTDTSFVSSVFLLEIPATTPLPLVNIDYENELLTHVPADCQWNVAGQFEDLADETIITEIVPSPPNTTFRVDLRIPSTVFGFASGTAILDIKPRSAAPVFVSYNDYTNIFKWQTLPAVSDIAAYEISLNAGITWAPATSTSVNVGDVVLNVGDIRIRVAASNDRLFFRGLEVVSTKAFSESALVTFEDVRANIERSFITGINAGMEYSITSTDGVNGTWLTSSTDTVHVEFAAEGGFKIFARQKDETANVSRILDVAPAADPPAYYIDFFNEKINKAFALDDEYDWQKDFGDAIDGDDLYVMQITPVDKDSILYVRTKATETTVSSKILQLTIPAKPMPVLSIDYRNETTFEVLSPLLRWSRNQDLSNATAGGNKVLPIAPGIILWYTQIASDHSFVSDTFMLQAPLRPALPEYSINYQDETTFEVVDAGVVWSFTKNMMDALAGKDEELALQPGKTIWFTVAASDQSFASKAFELPVPNRPAGPKAPVIDYANESLTGLSDSVELVLGDQVFESESGTFDLSYVISTTDSLLIAVRYPSDGISYFASLASSITIPKRPEVSKVVLEHVVSDKGRFEIDGQVVSDSLGLEYKIDLGDWIAIEDHTFVEMGGDRVITVHKPVSAISFESDLTDNLNRKLDAQLVDMIVVDGHFETRLVIGGIQYFPDSQIRIYTRWGNEIYKATNYMNEFDFRDYPAGTYYYIVTYTDNGTRKEFKNFVELIKKD